MVAVTQYTPPAINIEKDVGDTVVERRMVKYHLTVHIRRENNMKRFTFKIDRIKSMRFEDNDDYPEDRKIYLIIEVQKDERMAEDDSVEIEEIDETEDKKV